MWCGRGERDAVRPPSDRESSSRNYIRADIASFCFAQGVYTPAFSISRHDRPTFVIFNLKLVCEWARARCSMGFTLSVILSFGRHAHIQLIMQSISAPDRSDRARCPAHGAGPARRVRGPVACFPAIWHAPAPCIRIRPSRGRAAHQDRGPAPTRAPRHGPRLAHVGPCRP